MAHDDLREFLDDVEAIGELRHVDGANWDLEVGALVEVAAASPLCPTLLFDKIKGYRPGFRSVSNLLNTHTRMSLALGVSPETPKLDVLRMWKDRMRGYKPIPPVEVSDGPVKENVEVGEKVDITKFPAPRWHELDGGKYLGTGCVVIVRDPDEGWVNLGTYRLMVHDEKTLGIYISPGKNARLIRDKYWAQGKACPVAVSLAHEPSLWIAAPMYMPWALPEYELAGWIKGEPLKVIRGEITGLPVPAASEAVLEGEIPPAEVDSRDEGPFGEFTGYYASRIRKEAVIRVKSVWYRHEPIVNGAPPMKPVPGLDPFGIPFRAAAVWDSLEKNGIVDVRGVWQYGPGLSVISLKQRYVGHAKQAAMVAMGSPSGAYLGRFVVLVDDDIDPSDLKMVVWAVQSRCEPSESIDFIRNCWSTPLDARIMPEDRAKSNWGNSRAVIDACRPFHWIKEFPPVNEASPEMKSKVADKWKELLR